MYLDDLFSFLTNRGLPITHSSQYPKLCTMADDIIDYYDLPHEQEFYDILIDFGSNVALAQRELDFVTYRLRVASAKVHNGYYKQPTSIHELKPKPIISYKVWKHVRSQVFYPITPDEYFQIEIGFRLLWNYARHDKLLESDFVAAVERYLTAVEICYNHEGVVEVVESILKYLNLNGHWGEMPF